MGAVINQISAKFHSAFSAFLVTLITLFFMWPSATFAQSVTFPDRPAQHSFVVDQAQMLSESDLKAVNQMAQDILSDERIPLYVVTINSLDDFGADSMSIELYSQMLFDNWGIGYKKRNYGMLLVISKLDRRMRIELGKDWAGTRNQDAQYLVSRVMKPRFKEGNFSDGIVEGVHGMDKMGRGLALPSPYYGWWVLPTLVTLALFVFCMTVSVSISIIKSGKKGLGWAFLMLAFGGVIFLIKIIVGAILDTDGNGDGFAGGSSGGGGATGEW